MALNNLTRVTGSGFGTDTSINTAGIITATSFSGDGSALTGVVGSGSGIVVQEEGSNVGTAQTINFIGTGVTATLSGGIASIEITTSSGGGGGLSDIVSDTSPQLGGNLDINGKDVTGTGGVNLTGVITATTFSGSAASLTSIPAGQLTGTISDGRLPSTITSDITGNVTGTATISTNVTVADESSDTSCFLLYSTEATGNIAPKTGSNLTFNSSSGTLTASTFVGDGSGLTGITASGSGVVVRDGGSLVGTAGTIDFGTNVSVSPISAGVVTVTAAAGTIVGINTSGTTELNNLTIAGVATANSFSGTSGSFTILNGGVNTAFHVDGGAPAMSLHVENDGEISVETTLKVGTAITMSSGIITATTFSGSGASLTNLPAANITGTLPAISGANLTNLDASDLASGTIPDARFPATLPAASGANLTNLDASDLASGTIPDARFPATLPAVSGANLTNLPASTPADTDVQVTYDVSSNSSTGYRFTGPGYSGADDNPDLYLVRGQRYRFINTTGTGHPFRIQSDTSGTAYTDGVSGDQDGTQDFNVQHDAPVRLYYQCTIHSGMIGNIYIVGASDWRMTNVATSATPEIYTNLNVGIGTDNPLNGLDVNQSEGRLRVNRFSHLLMQNKNNSATDYWGISGRNNGDLDIGYGTPDGNSLIGGDKVTITSGGDVGIGEDTPGSRLHVKDADNQVATFETTLTSDMAIELKNSQGNMFFGLGGGEEFAVSASSDLNSVTDNHFVIKQTGLVGINELDPDTQLHIKGAFSQNDGNGYLKIQNTQAVTNSGSNTSLTIRSHNATSQFMNWEDRGMRIGQRIIHNSSTGDLYFTAGNDTVRLTINASNGNFTGSSSADISDGRLKENIQDISASDAVTIIKGLQGRTFTWKEEAKMGTDTKYGFIAQEVETVIPNLVHQNMGINRVSTASTTQGYGQGEIIDDYSDAYKDDTQSEWSKSVEKTGIIPVLVEALKDAFSKIETLETQNTSLEARLTALEG